MNFIELNNKKENRIKNLRAVARKILNKMHCFNFFVKAKNILCSLVKIEKKKKNAGHYASKNLLSSKIPQGAETLKSKYSCLHMFYGPFWYFYSHIFNCEAKHKTLFEKTQIKLITMFRTVIS